MMRARLFPNAVILAAAALACGCAGDDGSTDSESPDFEVVEPEAVGLDAATLEKAREYAFADGMNTQAVIVVRHGRIAAEWYADGRDRDSFAASWSIAKSITSAIVGMSIEDGTIPSVDVPMSNYIAPWAGDERSAITLEHMLHMASGLEWVEEYDNLDSHIATMVFTSESPADFAADRPLVAEPGTVFNYSSGDTQLLSRMFSVATGRTASEIAAERLFEPLGIEGAEWWSDSAGETLTYCCVDMTSRDFARFGQLFLQRGEWNGRQIVPESWVDASLTPSPASDWYGYQWWLTANWEPRLPADTYAAIGVDDQYIYVVPSLDLVVVRNGIYDKYDGEPVADPNLISRYSNAGLFPSYGTLAPERPWDDFSFLGPIVDAVTD